MGLTPSTIKAISHDPMPPAKVEQPAYRPSKPVIAFFGLKGSGKNSCAEALKKLGLQVRLVSIAQPLKEAVAALLGIKVELLEGNTKESRAYREKWHEGIMHMTSGSCQCPRHLLQILGTEVVRGFTEDFWLNIAAQRMAADNDHVDLYAITDTRFPNEMAAVSRWGGYRVLVKRPGVQAGDTHESEALPYDEDCFDAIVENDGTLESLPSRVAAVYMKLQASRLLPTPTHLEDYA